MKTNPTARGLKASILALLLSGCTSITIYHLTERTITQQASRADTEPARTQLCPKAEYATLPETPELPIKQLEAIPQGNDKAVSDIELQHIAELRAYIKTLKGQITTERQRYEQRCSVFVAANTADH